LGLIGESGIRDEDNVPRRKPPQAAWPDAGRVVEILPGRNFLPTRTQENDQTRELTDTAIESVVEALGGETILSGDLSRMLWINVWKHGDDLVSVHFLNYQVDFESGKATPTQPAKLTVAMPPGVPAQEAAWLAPGDKGQPLEIEVEGGKATVTIPSVGVYGVLAIGKRGLDAIPSALVHGDALVARAAMASGKRESPERPDPSTCTADEAASYVEAASNGLQRIQAVGDQAYLSRIRHSIDVGSAPLIRAFDFGSAEDHESWQPVSAETAYSADTGFGWLPATDASDTTPEETYYSMASRYGGKWATQITAGQLLFWPYKQPLPVELRTNLGCGAQQRFRVDVPPGDYTVRVLTTNPSWTNRNFLVSGMVTMNGEYQLLDAAHDKGTVRWRDFSASAPDGKLELAFGGPTGWAVAAMMIMRSAAPADPQAPGGLRRWKVSPRHANPDWLPISQVACPPEERLESLPDPGWTLVQAPPQGLPVVDLGTNRQAEVGDIVYAATTIDVPSACEQRLHFGATSQAQLWLGGKAIGYVPNEKGLRRDELAVPVRLRQGKNVLVVKLARFWERRWMFYARLAPASE
jgi:hypothetical protein